MSKTFASPGLLSCEARRVDELSVHHALLSKIKYACARILVRARLIDDNKIVLYFEFLFCS